MNNEVILYTCQIGKGSLLDPDVHLLDTTVKTGNKAFAPTWEMVLDYKASKLSEASYLDLYAKMMERSQQDNKNAWQALKTHPKLALMCYCRKEWFCHRHKLADIVQTYLEAEGVEVHRNYDEP